MSTTPNRVYISSRKPSQHEIMSKSIAIDGKVTNFALPAIFRVVEAGKAVDYTYNTNGEEFISEFGIENLLDASNLNGFDRAVVFNPTTKQIGHIEAFNLSQYIEKNANAIKNLLNLSASKDLQVQNEVENLKIYFGGKKIERTSPTSFNYAAPLGTTIELKSSDYPNDYVYVYNGEEKSGFVGKGLSDFYGAVHEEGVATSAYTTTFIVKPLATTKTLINENITILEFKIKKTPTSTLENYEAPALIAPVPESIEDFSYFNGVIQAKVATETNVVIASDNSFVVGAYVPRYGKLIVTTENGTVLAEKANTSYSHNHVYININTTERRLKFLIEISEPQA
ncbi:MAG: hypothetical protein KBA33_09320 [Cloacibacterium sp.]|nr:hypothetical protein [Cloacibacterium sp.]